jgi:hypothetical protein
VRSKLACELASPVLEHCANFSPCEFESKGRFRKKAHPANEYVSRKRHLTHKPLK